MLSYQKIQAESQAEGRFFNDHFYHLLVHGTLHLLGYDHKDPEEAVTMESIEIRILERLGIQNPYLDVNFAL